VRGLRVGRSGSGWLGCGMSWKRSRWQCHHPPDLNHPPDQAATEAAAAGPLRAAATDGGPTHTGTRSGANSLPAGL